MNKAAIRLTRTARNHRISQEPHTSNPTDVIQGHESRFTVGAAELTRHLSSWLVDISVWNHLLFKESPHLLLARVCGDVPNADILSCRVLHLDGGVIFRIIGTSVRH